MARHTQHRSIHYLAALLVLLVMGLARLPPAAAASAAAPITVPFDHLTTGFELDGVHRDLPCESCHVNAVFYGTPRDCGSCHTTGSQFNATPKTATHIPSTNNCAACHNTISFRPDFHFDHAEVLGNCVSCHNGTVAQGEGPNHPQTSQNCAACHTVMSWEPTKTVDHLQIPLAVSGYCIVCHNGVVAGGKPAGHLVTNLECGACHTTSSWLGADFDHSGITSGCYSCHNGTKAVGKVASHMPTSNVCEKCHTTGIGTRTPAWAPSLFDHTQMSVTTCQTCHNGKVQISTGYVAGQPTNHVPPIPSLIDCGVCHGNTPLAETWTKLAVNIAQLHAGLSVNNCLMCHAGQTFAGVPAPYSPMSTSGVSPTHAARLAPPHIPVLSNADCSGCHAAAYQSGGFGPATAMNAARHAYVSSNCVSCHETGSSFYTGSGTPLQLRPADHLSSTDATMVSGNCSQCHSTTDWNSSAFPAGHMPNPGNQGCIVCHTAAPANYTRLAANSVLHTGISSGCGQCHGGATALTWYNNFTPKDGVLTPAHVPYSAGVDCGSCHVSSTYAAGTFGPMNMTQAKHAFVATTCVTCHEAGRSFYMGAANPALQGRPADHTSGQMVAPNDCSLCHTTANWNSTALPAGHMPNPANQACTVCHTAAPTNYTTLAANAVLHTGISGGCGQCHGGTTALTWYNNFTPKDGVLTPAHIPYTASTDCSSCHTSSTYAAGTFGPMNMTQAKHAFVATTCVTCHEAGRSFFMGAANPGLQGRPADHTSGQMVAPNDCSLCHTTANWNSTALPAGHMPNPGNQGCTVCHTAAPTNYTTLAANPVLHTGISSGCITCHGSPAGALTFYNNFSPKSAVLSPVHIPTATTPCEDCHSRTVFTSFSGTTMSSAKHTAMFATIGSTCDACHNRVTPALSFYGVNNLQTRPSEHSGNMKTEDCSSCHNTNNWDAGAQKRTTKSTTTSTATATAAKVVVRPQVGSTASSPLLQFLNPTASTPAAPPVVSTPLITGMPAAAAGAGAAAAGSGIMAAAGGAGARGQGFSHLGLSATCLSCHNGVTAAGKGLRHVASDNNCANCHTTIAWLPARFDHRGITARCSSCHNGVAAPGRSTTHIPTALDCASCHSTISWRPARFAHTGTLGNCQSCHNALTGLGKPQTHLSTALDCGACHDTVSWASVIARPPARPARPVLRPGATGRDK